MTRTTVRVLVRQCTKGKSIKSICHIKSMPRVRETAKGSTKLTCPLVPGLLPNVRGSSERRGRGVSC